MVKNTHFFKYWCAPVLRYLSVGFVASMVDLGLLYTLTERGNLYYLFAALWAFSVSILVSFILNKYFTFRCNCPKKAPRQFEQFMLISVLGLVINLSCLWFLVEFADINYLWAAVVAIGAAGIWNFIGYHSLVFAKKQLFNFLHPAEYDVSFIIPCYNEVDRIYNLELIFEFIKKSNLSAGVIVVNDGSTDQTLEKLKHLSSGYDNLQVVSYLQNQGKGYAIKQGYRSAKGKYCLFCDIDNLGFYETLKTIIAELDHGYEIVIANRNLLKTSETGQPWYRVFIGKVGNIIIRKLLQLNSSDTQCGIKGFQREILPTLLSQSVMQRWAFDVEWLMLAEKKGYKIKEIPIDWEHDHRSKFSPMKDSIPTFLDILRVKLLDMFGFYK